MHSHYHTLLTKNHNGLEWVLFWVFFLLLYSNFLPLMILFKIDSNIIKQTTNTQTKKLSFLHSSVCPLLFRKFILLYCTLCYSIVKQYYMSFAIPRHCNVSPGFLNFCEGIFVHGYLFKMMQRDAMESPIQPSYLCASPHHFVFVFALF